MAKPTLDQLRNNFGGTEKRDFTTLPNNYYPFWNIDFDASCEVRFLPDLNEDNPFGFLVEKLTHSLSINGKERKVPCLSMYGEECPICAVSQDYYKNNDKINGAKYWKKRQYIAQAIIMDSPIPVKEGEESPIGQVKLLAINPTLFKIIKDAFDSNELDEVPFDFYNGTNFFIKKTKQGQYADYSLSKFARRESPIPAEILETLDTAMVDLSTVLPRNPGREKVDALLDADLSGVEYNEDDDNSRQSNTASTQPKVETTTEPKVESVDAPEPTAAVDEAGDDLLARIRARRQSQEG